MRYRKLDSNGDYSMGHGDSDWLVNSPACVAQAITTTLKLFQGEWFANINSGFPIQNVIGFGNLLQCDYAFTETVASVPGFKDFAQYQSYYNPATRTFLPTATIDTIYGKINYSLPITL